MKPSNRPSSQPVTFQPQPLPTMMPTLFPFKAPIVIPSKTPTTAPVTSPTTAVRCFWEVAMSSIERMLLFYFVSRLLATCPLQSPSRPLSPSSNSPIRSPTNSPLTNKPTSAVSAQVSFCFDTFALIITPQTKSLIHISQPSNHQPLTLFRLSRPSSHQQLSLLQAPLLPSQANRPSHSSLRLVRLLLGPSH